DQRVVGGAALEREHPANRQRRARVGSESVDRLRGKRDGLAASEQSGGLGDGDGWQRALGYFFLVPVSVTSSGSTGGEHWPHVSKPARRMLFVVVMAQVWSPP